MSEAVAGSPSGAAGSGSVLGGKYRLTRRLGDGAMGAVYAAVHEGLGREVAVKILRPDLCSHPESAARFQREAELVTRLGHPNIVAVYDFGHAADGGLYYVMELIAGRTLRARFDEGPLTDDEMVQVFAPLLSALQVAHSVGVVHRDLKPENVMLVQATGSPVPEVKLLDFGVAKIREDRGGGGAAASANGNGLLTSAGALMGTPAYMSPEQAQNSATVDHRADLYALGVLLFEALCGQRPFSGHNIGELIGAHLFQKAPKPSVVAQQKRLPRRQIDWRKLDATIDKTLAKAPGDRFQNCASLSQSLEAAWGHHGQWAEAGQGYSSQISLAPAYAAKKSPPRRWLIGVAALVLGAAGGGWRWHAHHQPRAVVVDADAPVARAAARLQAAQHGGVAERRALVAAVELVRSRALLTYVEAALRDPAAAVWSAAVPVAAAVGSPADTSLRALLTQRATQPAGAIAVELAAARLRLGDQAAIPGLTAAAAGEAAAPRLRATLALAQAGVVPAAALQRVVARSDGASGITPALRQAALLQLVKMGDAATEKQLQQALQESSPDPAAQERQEEALIVYARAGRPAAQTQLAQQSQHGPVPRRLDLAVALADAHDARAVALLLPLCRDATPRVRQRAAGALGSLGATAAAGESALTTLLDDPDPGVALTASAALLGLRAGPAAATPAESLRPSPASSGLHAHG